MTDQNTTLRDDIAFMKSLAEAGRDRPMAGGSILLMCGLVFGAASLAVWYLSAVQGLGGWMYLAVWGSATVAFAILLPWLIRRLPKTAGAYQTASGVAWSAVGLSIFFIWASLMVISVKLEIPDLMVVFPSILMALYGGAWWVGAVLLRQRWLHAVAFGSFAMAVVNGWYADGPAMWLIYGVSLLALLAAPGWVLMRQARRTA